jgi:hypothetical protein
MVARMHAMWFQKDIQFQHGSNNHQERREQSGSECRLGSSLRMAAELHLLWHAESFRVEARVYDAADSAMLRGIRTRIAGWIGRIVEALRQSGIYQLAGEVGMMQRHRLPRILFFRPHPIPVRHAISEPRLYALRVLQILLNGLLAAVYFVTIAFLLFWAAQIIWDLQGPLDTHTVNLRPLAENGN